MKRRSGDNLFVCSVVVCIIYVEVACWHNLIDTSRNENKKVLFMYRNYKLELLS